jgi:hypothetical protein
VQKIWLLHGPSLVSVPLSGGPWMMVCVSHCPGSCDGDPEEVNARLTTHGGTGLQYYNGHMHQAGMALPNCIRGAVARTGVWWGGLA